MKSIVFFNNKGGVGKTTLSCNVASFLSDRHNKRILLIDLDPQCNATQSILTEDKLSNIYEDGKQKTIFNVIYPFSQGDSTLDLNIEPIISSENLFRVDLIPGHPKMSMLEDNLSEAWSKVLPGLPEGFRKTNWVNLLIKHFAARYDFILIDVGPSLASLNRSVLIGSDLMLSPFGCDIFSILGIKNIADWVSSWSKLYTNGIKILQQQNPTAITDHDLIENIETKFRFIGYSVQQYVKRSFKSGKRPVRSYDQIMSEIPGVIENYMATLKPSSIANSELALADIPYVYSLVPRAQTNRCPIHLLKGKDGVTGTMHKQINEYTEIMVKLTNNLLNNIGKV